MINSQPQEKIKLREKRYFPFNKENYSSANKGDREKEEEIVVVKMQ